MVTLQYLDSVVCKGVDGDVKTHPPIPKNSLFGTWVNLGNLGHINQLHK